MKKLVRRLEFWHPARLNQLMNCHWSKRAALRRCDDSFVALAFRGDPAAHCKRRVSIEITLGPRQRAGDPDAYWKSLLDAMVKAGVLVDDSRQWCELGSVTFRRAARKATTITVEELEDSR